MGNIITLLTDFGLDDAHVGVMKGVILGVNPEANIVDLCHTVEPQNVAQAAFVLGTASRYFPQGTIHVVVVDPGVGSQRRIVIVNTPRYCFLAPDNGVLSYVLAEHVAEHTEEGLQPVKLAADLEAVAVTNPRYWLSLLSATFHGRDIFAPVAAQLSLGTPLEEFGGGINSLLALPIPRPQVGQNGIIRGRVIHVDRFGNLISDIAAADLPQCGVVIEVAGRRIAGLSPSYQEGDELLAIIGSSERLEIAVKNGSAAASLGARVGDEVRVTNPYPEH